MNTKCPRCGSEKDFRPVEVEAKSGLDTFLIFGSLGCRLQKEVTGKKLLCEKCNFVFGQKRTSNWADLATFLFVIILIIAGLLYGFYWADPATFKTLFF
jgi:uncharacterized protein (DUF983 family)